MTSKSSKVDWTRWAAFADDLEKKRSELGFMPGEECFYRGVSDGGQKLMTPSLFRAFPDEDKAWEAEVDLFFEFRARARELHDRPMSGWDTLFMMQHYTVPTRLLDWTDVSGIAIAFALYSWSRGGKVEDLAQKEPAIFLLNPYSLNDEAGYGRDLIAPENLGWDQKSREFWDYHDLLLGDQEYEAGMRWQPPLAIYPQQKAARMGAQHGWFTIHGDKVGSFTDLAPTKCWRKVPIPAEVIPTALEFLSMAGLDQYALFPDLDGLARALKSKYQA